MSLLNPSALWLLALVPVVVFACLIRRKIRERRVSTMFLWDETFERAFSRSRGFKLRSLLSLLLALAVTLALIAAICDPVARGGGKNSPLIVVVDVSASMNAVEPDGQTRFERAKKTLRQIISNKGDDREILILTTAQPPEIVCGFTKDYGVLRASLNRVVPGLDAAAALDALEKARFFQQSRPDSTILFLSDGDFARADEFVREVADDKSFAFQKIGSPLDNLALLLCEPRRNPSGDPSFETLVKVANYSRNPAAFNVELALDGNLLDVVPFELEPDAVETRIVVNQSVSGGALTGTLVPPDRGDAMKVDDVRERTLSGFPKLDILLYGDYDRFMETVLRAQPNVDVSIVENVPEMLAATELFVVCGRPPKTLPKGKVVLVAPTESCNLFDLGEPVGETYADGDVLDASITRYVRLDGVPLYGVRELTLAKGATAKIFARAPEAPIALVASPENDPDSVCVVLNFSTENNSIALQTLFPILYANIVGAARGETDEKFDVANFPDPEESNLRAEALDSVAIDNAYSLDARTPPWTLLALFALVVATLEFYLYCRRRVE